jgi:hypothetical protein
MDKEQNKFCGVCGEENKIFHEDFKDGDEVTWQEYFWVDGWYGWNGKKESIVLSGKIYLDGIAHDKETKAYLENHKPLNWSLEKAKYRLYYERTPLAEITYHGLNHHLDGMALTAKEWYKNKTK